MKLSYPALASLTLTSALLSACGAQTPQYGAPAVASRQSLSVFGARFVPGNAGRRRLVSPPQSDAKAGGHIAVAEFGALEVLWFPLNDKKNKAPSECEPALSTNGIAIDRQGDLWVPNGQADTVTEYAPHCGAAKLTISDATGEPADIGFDKHRVYVLNLNDKTGPPTVEVYDAVNGAHRATLTDASFNDLFGIGTDRRGNVFVSNLTANNVGTVVEFPKGKMPGTQLSGISLGLPGAPTFDRSDNLIITDWERSTIDVFKPPYTGSPATATLEGASIWCKLNAAQSHLYCGDADNGSIDVYGYPALRYKYSYTASLSPSALVTGVAPDPPAAY